jgi:pimeloyl-ACP methyl ester carboxylesterase
VKAVWLLDAAGTVAAHDSPMLQNYLATGDSPLLLRSQADVARLIRTTMARPPYFPGFLKRTLGARAIADYPLHSEIIKDLTQNSPMLEAQYTTLPTPALIVWGSEDGILNPTGAQTQERLFPHHQTIVMHGIGHLPMLEAPGKTAQDFMKFAKALPA